jgi:hypothetical protein
MSLGKCLSGQMSSMQTSYGQMSFWANVFGQMSLGKRCIGKCCNTANNIDSELSTAKKGINWQP